MKSVVKKWGNSASVRIPAAVLEAVHLELDDPVDIREDSGRIVIVPLQRREYDIETLVKRITPKNRHREMHVNGPVGDETW